jgi:hypothetical protein
LKRFIGYAAILALVSIPAFAANKSENIVIGHPVMAGTTQLPAATYKVTWSETSSNAQVTLTHGKTVVTLPAKVIEQKHEINTFRTTEKGGATVLLGIDLSKVSVEFTPSPSSGQ